METAYIGIGSNRGDPRRNCLEATDRIGRINGCKIISVSGLYLTQPIGVSGQDWYVNRAVSVSTIMQAHDLISVLLDMEKNMGRVRTVKWGPRIIDLDILLFGQDIINDRVLTVPHPMMHLRRFVMAPMAEIAPDLTHPVLRRTMSELFREIPAEDQVIKLIEGV